MDILVGIVIGIVITLAIANAVARVYIHIQSKKLDAALESGLAKLKETIVPARIEDVNGMLFLYNKETEEFLAQGKTFEELNRSAKDRFPNKLFNVPQSELDKYTKKG
jgi:hypothetical protein